MESVQRGVHAFSGLLLSSLSIARGQEGGKQRGAQETLKTNSSVCPPSSAVAAASAAFTRTHAALVPNSMDVFFFFLSSKKKNTQPDKTLSTLALLHPRLPVSLLLFCRRFSLPGVCVSI